MDDPEVHGIAFREGVLAAHFVDHAVAVVGVRGLEGHRPVGVEVLRAVAQPPLDVAADEEELRRDGRLGHMDDARQVLDEVAEARLGLPRVLDGPGAHHGAGSDLGEQAQQMELPVVEEARLATVNAGDAHRLVGADQGHDRQRAIAAPARLGDQRDRGIGILEGLDHRLAGDDGAPDRPLGPGAARLDGGELRAIRPCVCGRAGVQGALIEEADPARVGAQLHGVLRQVAQDAQQVAGRRQRLAHAPQAGHLLERQAARRLRGPPVAGNAVHAHEPTLGVQPRQSVHHERHVATVATTHPQLDPPTRLARRQPLPQRPGRLAVVGMDVVEDRRSDHLVRLVAQDVADPRVDARQALLCVRRENEVERRLGHSRIIRVHVTNHRKPHPQGRLPAPDSSKCPSGNQEEAVRGQRSEVSGQRSAIRGQQDRRAPAPDV